jgi:menaquinone-specific isochorismate synthase
MSKLGKLRVLTREIATPEGFDITKHFPEDGTVFIRGGQGIVGFGEVARFETSGPNRISELASIWRDQVSLAEVTDSLRIQCTGLVAFGSVTFSEDSTINSVLVVPRLVLGTRDGRSWITEIVPEGEDSISADFLTQPVSYRANEKLKFYDGAMSAEMFLSQAEAAIEKIRAGRIQKVVLARDIVAQLPSGFDLRTALRNLAVRYPSCWVYSVAGNFGASPELLVRVSHAQAHDQIVVVRMILR